MICKGIDECLYETRDGYIRQRTVKYFVPKKKGRDVFG